MTQPALHYRVAMPAPASHLFEVTLTVRDWQAPTLDLKMPVWTPGSYLVREYARHLQDFAAQVGDRPLTARKLAKNHWQIATDGATELTVFYRLYANELTVRTNHLDATHGYFNGAATFFYVPGYEDCPIEVAIAPPHPEWQVATPLDPVSETAAGRQVFRAKDFDELVDSPFEVGIHELHEFEARGKTHQYAIWGRGNANVARIVADTRKIIEVEADLFGELPYERYLFILHLSAGGYGGLEHKDSCSLNYPRLGFQAKDRYQRFLQLVAHEFFHLWNVKRLRPAELKTFDYDSENYTELLWFFEGATSYYDLLIPLRAGIYDAETFLDNVAKDISRLQSTPGRLVQPLAESSFDAWIKLYRRDEYSNNNQISYYLKGQFVSLLLDLLIRDRTQNARSLDDVMRQLWQTYGRNEAGVSSEQLAAVLAEVAGTDVRDFLAQVLTTTAELPFAEYLAPFGLELIPHLPEDMPPHLGLKLADEAGKTTVKFSQATGPAGTVGIEAGDQLLAIDGLRVTAANLDDRLRDYRSGDRLELALFHQDELVLRTVTLTAPEPQGYRLTAVADPTAIQQERYHGWLGVPLV
ncbi:MAG: M61 family metallopeptidase [Cyanobacteria bacterium J06641_5]